MDGDRLADADGTEVALVDVRQDPDRAHVRDREDLGLAGLNNLTGRHQAFDDFAADGREDRNLRCPRVFRQATQVRNSQHAERLLGRLQVRLALGA